MSKLTVLFYGFALVVLALFGVFSYLMTTVNPDRLPEGPTTEAEVPDVSDADDEASVEPPDETGDARKLMGSTPEWLSSTVTPVESISIAESVRDRKSINDTNDSKSSKGRRSVNDRWRKNDKGIVIMKIFGDQGKPRIEIVLHPKRPKNIKWKNKIRTNNLYYPTRHDTKRRNAEFIYNSVLNIMPDDTVILEKADYSPNPDLESYSKIRKETTENAANDKEVFATDSIWINSFKTPNYDQVVNEQSFKAATEGRYDVEVQTKINNTESIKDVFDSKSFWIESLKISSKVTTKADLSNNQENTKNVLSFTVPNFNISSRSIDIWSHILAENSPNDTTGVPTSAYPVTYEKKIEVTSAKFPSVNNTVANTTVSINGLDLEKYADTLSVVVTDTDFYKAATNDFTTTYPAPGDYGDQLTSVTFSKVDNTLTDDVKTLREISSENTERIT